MDGPEISFLIRGTNGQIGYISEGLTVPEFFNLVRSRNDNKRVLVDFSPVIDALHQLHSQSHNEAILAKYNVLYNYWLDAKTHTKELVKFHKSEEISKQSNSLISELQLSLQKRGSAARYHSIALLEDVCEIKKDSNIYIDSMLCLERLTKPAGQGASSKTVRCTARRCNAAMRVLLGALSLLQGLLRHWLIQG